MRGPAFRRRTSSGSLTAPTVSSARTPGSATGSGLGLAIVKTITERHGGTVSCENAPGAGSIFSVTLPAKFLQS
ncbi:MAG: ATP-binding protein [Waltera sp.]